MITSVICYKITKLQFLKVAKGPSKVNRKRIYYVAKLETIIDDSVTISTYVETSRKTFREVMEFKNFIYKNFRNHER